MNNIEESDDFLQEAARIRARGEATRRMLAKIFKIVLVIIVMCTVLVSGIIFYTHNPRSEITETLKITN